MKRAKAGIKWLLSLVLKSSGATSPGRIRRRLERFGGILTVAYHSVSREAGANGPLTGTPYQVEPSVFADQIRTLARRFDGISLADLEAFHSRERALPPRPCLLTFDDGWRDNYDTAWAVLRKEAVPWTIFLATDLVGTRRLFWTHRLWMLMRTQPEKARRLWAGIGRREAAYRNAPAWGTPADGTRAAALAERFFEAVSTLPPRERWKAVDAVTRASESTAASRRFYLSWEEIRELRRDGVGFGAHGHSHHPLTWLAEGALHRELSASKRIVEDALGQAAGALSFPHSRYDARETAAAAAAGFAILLGGGVAHPSTGGKRLSVYPRIGISPSAGLTPGGRFSEALFLFHLTKQVRELRYVPGR